MRLPINFFLFIGSGTAYYGLILTSFMTILPKWQFLMRDTIDIENLMTSIERIVEYGNLNPEADLHTLSEPVDKLVGSITFQNVWLRYADNQDYVLKDLSFKIEEQEKVGLLGDIIENRLLKLTFTDRCCGTDRCW